MVPTELFPPATPSTLQFTTAAVPSAFLALKVACCPNPKVVDAGLTVMADVGVGVGVGVGAGVFEDDDPPPPQATNSIRKMQAEPALNMFFIEIRTRFPAGKSLIS
jgi:hypothetical protein